MTEKEEKELEERKKQMAKRKECVQEILYEAFKETNFDETTKLIGFDPKNNTILISKLVLMQLIQLVSPAQPYRKIRLVKDFSKMNFHWHERGIASL